VLSGGFVAGLKAGHAFNTFPLMAGQWIPPGYAVLEPFWRNVFENIPTVQFHHRLLAVTTLIATGLFVMRVLRDSALTMYRRLISLLGVVVLVQVGVGITTLVTYVPIPLAAVHQAMALIVLSVMLYTVFRFRRT